MEDRKSHNTDPAEVTRIEVYRQIYREGLLDKVIEPKEVSHSRLLSELRMNGIEFHVTKQDISSGQVGSCSFCPAALALKRTLDERFPGHFIQPRLGLSAGSLHFEVSKFLPRRRAYGFPISRALSSWIWNFDSKNDKADEFQGKIILY